MLFGYSYLTFLNGLQQPSTKECGGAPSVADATLASDRPNVLLELWIQPTLISSFVRIFYYYNILINCIFNYFTIELFIH